MTTQPDNMNWNTLILKKGQFLFKQKEYSQDLYIIKNGRVRVFKTEGELEIELDILSTGMVVGEVASIDGGFRSASVVALEDTELFFISASDFKSVLLRIPEYLKKIALILVQRLREVDSRINFSIDGNRLGHFAAVISLIASSEWSVKESLHTSIDRKFLENELMDILNVSPQQILLVLDLLEKKQIISTERGRIFITNKEDLEYLANSVFHGSNEVPII